MKAILSILLLILATGQMALASEQVTFYTTDPTGTPLAMTDSTGAVVWQADYRPFGDENSITGSASNNKRFVGKEKDTETGFSYFGARYEDAKTGRFIAVDPVGAVDEKTSKTNEKMLLNPQRLNSYAYGVNNPYRYVDQDGHNPVLLGLFFVWLGEMAMPQTIGSSSSDSFINRHWGDLLMLPLGIEKESAVLASKTVASLAKQAAPKGLQLVDGAKMSIDQALGAAETFLGKGYKDIGKGRFVSSDGFRQVRMGDTDILGFHGGGPHINFETFDRPIQKGAKMLENIHIKLTD